MDSVLMKKTRRYNADLAKIHIAKKDLAMDDDSYRAMLMKVTGQSSSSQLDFHQRQAVLNHLKELGWKPKRKVSKTGQTSKKLPTQQITLEDGSKATVEIGRKRQSDMIRALWIQMFEQNIVRDKSEHALSGYVKRMTNGRFEAAQFLDVPEAQRIIEALKKWQQRELDKRQLESMGADQ